MEKITTEGTLFAEHALEHGVNGNVALRGNTSIVECVVQASLIRGADSLHVVHKSFVGELNSVGVLKVLRLAGVLGSGGKHLVEVGFHF